eukprot:TRINITY_DN5409_c0_g1_i7.p2 TRINITY_DN5409_c0_g1~~TRINITY_DN5409_c0_g1_i7.p2  ORF type:complete len:443 (+),score=87.03 TRINITY_DN5409_c0_g1_i7:1469-2797(+)
MGCCESNAAAPSSAERPVPATKRAVKAEQARPDPKDYGEWPWSRPSPDERKTFKKQTVDFYYSKEYLQSFKILNAVEAKAYEAYLNDDLEQARSILDNRGVLSTPVVSPLQAESPDDSFLDEQVERVRGGSVSAVPDGAGTSRQGHGLVSGPTSPRTPRTESTIMAAIRRCPLFTHLSSNFKEHEVVAQNMVRKEFPSGHSVYTTGEYPSDDLRCWYVVIQGKGLIRRRKVKELRMPGDFFGEMLVTNATCKSNIDVRASDQPLVTYSLDHHTFSKVLSSIAHQRREKYKEELRKVTVGNRKPFGELTEGGLAQLADCLTERSYRPGDSIIKYGEPGRFAHIIMKGRVSVIGRKNGSPFKVCEFAEGEDPIGFLEFFSSEEELTIADVVASPESSSNVVTACINKEHFEKCIGSVKELFKDAADTDQVYGYYRDVKQGSIPA